MSKKNEFDAWHPESYVTQHERKIGITTSVLVVLLVLCIVGKQEFGLKQPGTFLERASYDARVYVLVFPDNNSKNYYLPADITRDQGYTLDTLYWPDGGATDFSDSDCTLYLNQKTDCGDGNNNDYQIELTGNLAK